MRIRIHRTGPAVALAIACLALASSASADSVEIAGDGANSTEGLGSFTGLLDYQADPFSTVGLLTVELNNTTTPDKGGYITGFLFNIASMDANASATLLGDPLPTHPFQQCTGNGLNGPPFGKPFDAGAALGGSFLGGGSPTEGIAAGDSGAFSFEVAASDAGDLTAISFLDGGPFEFNFIVRFKAIDGDSDKVPATVVPLPAPVAMGAAGLAWMILAARRYRRSAKKID